jgi:dTMP kinase
MKKGYFITFEGPDGAGKTTQIDLLSDYFKSQGYDVVLTREPGGTELGEKIRQVIFEPGKQGMAPEAEVLLYAASRAQHIKEVIAPNLLAGNVVISDRFIDSSIAYQGFGRGMLDYVELVNNYITKDFMPLLRTSSAAMTKPNINSTLRNCCRKFCWGSTPCAWVQRANSSTATPM